MASRIRMEPEVAEANLAAGEAAPVKVVVTNVGHVVDAFDMAVRDLDPGWYDLSPQQVSLFPGDQSAVTLRLHPPKGAASPAGTYPFWLVTTSRDTPSETANTPMVLHVPIVGELGMDIEPRRIAARRGTYTLALINSGNAPREVVLRPTDPEERLAFAFGEARTGPYHDNVAKETPEPSPVDGASTPPVADSGTQPGTVATLLPSTIPTEWTGPGAEAGQGCLSMTMPPSSRVQIPLTVHTRSRIWFGRRAVQLPFEVAATPPGLEWEEIEARRVHGELEYGPILAWWSALSPILQRAIPIVIMLLLLAGVVAMVATAPKPEAQGPTAGMYATQTAMTAAQLTALANAAATQTAMAKAATDAAAANAATMTALAQQNANATRTALASGGGPGGGQTTGLPVIARFDLVRNPDGTFLAEWSVTNATIVTLNGVQVSPSGSQAVDSTSDQALILAATNGRDTVTQSRGVMLVKAPQVVSFTADPAEVCLGCEVTLNWKVARAEKLTLDGQPLDGATGSIKLKPTASKEYLLVAENALGKDIKLITVNVRPDITPTANRTGY